MELAASERACPDGRCPFKGHLCIVTAQRCRVVCPTGRKWRSASNNGTFTGEIMRVDGNLIYDGAPKAPFDVKVLAP